VQSFQMLIQWLHQGRGVIPPLEPPGQITLAIGFVRLSAVYGITGIETLIAGHIKTLWIWEGGG
jgi:hypothetical protein